MSQHSGVAAAIAHLSRNIGTSRTIAIVQYPSVSHLVAPSQNYRKISRGLGITDIAASRTIANYRGISAHRSSQHRVIANYRKLSWDLGTSQHRDLSQSIAGGSAHRSIARSLIFTSGQKNAIISAALRARMLEGWGLHHPCRQRWLRLLA